MFMAEIQLCSLQSVCRSFSSLGSKRLDLAGELVALLITSIHLGKEKEQGSRSAQLLTNTSSCFCYSLYYFHQTSQDICFPSFFLPHFFLKGNILFQ